MVFSFRVEMRTNFMRWIILYSVFASSILISIPTIAQVSDTPLITVSGSATEFIPVEELHFTISIEVLDGELPMVRQQSKAEAKRVFSYLSEAKIPNQYIQTKTININKNYDHRNGRKTLLGYKATQSIYVCLKDMDLFDKVIDSLLTMKSVSVAGPEYKSSQYKDAMMKAKIAAVQDAKNRAKVMAESIDQSVGKAKIILEEQSKSGIITYDNVLPQNEVDPSLESIRVGQLQVSAKVLVSFELLE